MRKSWLWLWLILGLIPAAEAQTGAIQGHSYLGGTRAFVSGLPSINYLDGIVPSATICVYLTGTQTLATIYADSSGTPLASCFTSNTSTSLNPGGYVFWAATGQGYDVVGSGGVAPNIYPAAITLQTDVFAGGGGGGGGSYPSLPGIANCTGTPCTAWAPSYSSVNPVPIDLIAPSGVNGQILSTQGGLPTWIAPGGSTSPGGSVAYVELTSPGSYTVCPTTVAFVGGGSPSASAVASVFCSDEGGLVVPTAVILSQSGYGYTSTPSVTISGGTGSGATAIAEMGSFVIAINTFPTADGSIQASLEDGILYLPYYSSSSQVPGNYLTIFGASGSSHGPGAVPDPGATAGTTRFLREDNSWAVPSGGGGFPGGSIYNLQFQGASSTFSGLSGLTTDSTGVGNLTTTGFFHNSPSNVPFSGSCLFAADCPTMTETRNYGQVLTQGGGSVLLTQQLSNWTATYNGIGLLASNAGTIGTSTNIGYNGTMNTTTQGQNIFQGGHFNCYAGGDCSLGSLYLTSFGGGGQASGEGTHLSWEQAYSGGNGSQICTANCNPNSVSMVLNNLTVGQGMVLFDQTQSTAMTITGWVAPSSEMPYGQFTATGLALGTSTIYQVTTTIPPPQPNPGTNPNYIPPAVTVAISTSPTWTGAATTTGSVASSGYACIADSTTPAPGYEFFERVPYTTVDGTHFSISPWWPHSANFILAIGGGCGYGAEQHATTTSNGAKIVVPIIASLSSTNFIYAGGNEFYYLGLSGSHNYENASCTPTLVSRAIVGSTWTNYITAASCTGLASGTLNQVTASVSGVTGASGFNEANVLMTAVPGVANQYSYTSTTTGAVSPTSISAGTVTAGDQSGFVYPTVLVTDPIDASTGTGDGLISTTPWLSLAPDDVIAYSLPAYSRFAGGEEVIDPNEDQIQGPIGHQVSLAGGASRLSPNSPSYGELIQNSGAYSQYQTFGGTYLPPTAGVYTQGLWQYSLFSNAPTNALLFVSDGTMKSYPGTGCFGYHIFSSTNSSNSIDTEDCTNLGDSQNSTLGINAHNVNLGYAGGPYILGLQIFNDAANGTNVLSNIPVTFAPQAGTPGDALTLTAVSGHKALVAGGEVDLNGATYAAGLTSTTGVTSCVVAGTGTQLFTETCPGGSSGISGLTAGYLPLAGSATTITANSHIDDGVTTAATLTASEPIAVTGVQGLTLTAGTAASGATGKVVYGVDATNGYAEVNENNTGLARVCTATNSVCTSSGIANTTFTNATTAIGANACSASAVTVTLTGLATSSVIFITPSTDVSGSTGWGSSGGLVIDAWPSATNTMSYKICNQTASSITPAAVTWNVGAR